VIRLRRRYRWGADHIAHETGLAASTVQSILRAEGLGRLDRGDRATTTKAIRYQRDRPGELVHVDIKKLAAIPDGGGWRHHGRGQVPRRSVGYRYLHSAIDDRTRLVYSEICDDEQAGTAGWRPRSGVTAAGTEVPASRFRGLWLGPGSGRSEESA
jgi:hypothetical protein